jgi:hypothetical protein
MYWCVDRNFNDSYKEDFHKEYLITEKDNFAYIIVRSDNRIYVSCGMYRIHDFPSGLILDDCECLYDKLIHRKSEEEIEKELNRLRDKYSIKLSRTRKISCLNFMK